MAFKRVVIRANTRITTHLPIQEGWKAELDYSLVVNVWREEDVLGEADIRVQRNSGSAPSLLPRFIYIRLMGVNTAIDSGTQTWV